MGILSITDQVSPSAFPAPSLPGRAPPPREPGDVRPRPGPSPELPGRPPRPALPSAESVPLGAWRRRRRREGALQPGARRGPPPRRPPARPARPPLTPLSPQPPLVQAIFSRDVEEVRSLLSQKENINVLVSAGRGEGEPGIRPRVPTPPRPPAGLRAPRSDDAAALSAPVGAGARVGDGEGSARSADTVPSEGTAARRAGPRAHPPRRRRGPGVGVGSAEPAGRGRGERPGLRLSAAAAPLFRLLRTRSGEPRCTLLPTSAMSPSSSCY